jgi:hypothetical protein
MFVVTDVSEERIDIFWVQDVLEEMQDSYL